MPTTTRGQDIFYMITGDLKKMNLTWMICVGICTYGAPCMVGCVKGFASLAQKKYPNLVHTQCFIHREVLVSKVSQENLKQVLHEVVEIVNYIKSRPIKSRLFEELCKSMVSQHIRLLMHTDFRWVSKGKVQTRVHESQKELIVFFDKEKHEGFWISNGDPRHPSPLCPLCLMHDHTASHLFECKSLPTSLSSLDLWTNPDKVEPFLAT